MSPSLNEVIAREVRSMRLARGWTQDELAANMREAGFGGWGRSMVAALENHRRQISPGDLLSLSVVFQVTVADLVPQGLGSVSLDDGTEVPSGFARDVLSADRLTKKLAVIRKYGLGAEPVLGLTPVQKAARSELEQKIARQLGLDAQVVAEAAISLFGRSATEERDSRTAGRPGTGPRRYASRLVREELVTEINKRQRGGSPGGDASPSSPDPIASRRAARPDRGS